MLLWGVFDLLLFAVSLLVCYVALTYLKVGAGWLTAISVGVLIIIKVG
jgi:dolichol kinase